MEVRKGYKQTDVGVIPEEWGVKSFAEIGHFRTGPFGTLLKADEYYANEGVPLVSVRDIGEGKLTFNEHTPLVPPSVVRRLPEYVLNSGDIVFGRKGGVDRSAIVQKSQSGCFLGSDGIRIRPSKVCHPLFVAYQLQRKHIQAWLLQNATGTTMPSMNQSILSRISLPFPPTLAEQTAIAEALTDADLLIESLEQLLTKNRQVKQGALQELLTGKKRILGFSGKWKEIILDEFVNIFKGSGLSKKKITENGKYKCILYGELFTTYSRVITNVVSSTNSTEGVFSVQGDILLPGSTTTTGIDLAIVSALLLSDVKLGGDVNIIRSKNTVPFSPEFLANYITYVLRHSIAEIAQGTTIFHLYGKNLKSLSVTLPTLEEQQAIAETLSDMDAEITTLEKILTKARQIKQGMMQELLTGRIRLI